MFFFKYQQNFEKVLDKMLEKRLFGIAQKNRKKPQ